MEYLTAEKYSFTTTALPDDTFAVVNFKGFEGISKPYEFTIMLVSGVPDIDLSGKLSFTAKLTFHGEDGIDVDFHGILAQFEQLHEYQGYVFYRAHLVPKLWWLNLTMHNQVILDKSLQTIIENTLKDGGLTSMDYEFKLQGTYPKIDYVCQYGESHLNFVSRWCEREGIYYYFEQTASGGKVIFTDTKISHTDLPLDAVLYYAPPSGLDTLHRTEVIKSFTCRDRQLPLNVKLKDYNYERPSLEISGAADVEQNGRGTAYLYGEHFLTTDEGNRLAHIRAEELHCRKREFFGESTAPFMIPGYMFSLQDHYRSDFNRKYLITELIHEGTQTGYLISGIRSALTGMEEQVYYRNQFTAIPDDVQFRPERKAQKPRIPGAINARVDAEGSGDYAELDSQGRYKIRLPFDLNDEHGAGKASSFIRMTQPYSGPGYGVHFPLHKDAEVLLTFVNGDPDRPVIAGAVPNPETASPVTDTNQTQSVIRDNYGNEILFDATPGDEHIGLYSPHHNSFLEIGRSVLSYSDSDAGDVKLGNFYELGLGTKLAASIGVSAEARLALSLAIAAGMKCDAFFGGGHTFGYGYNFELTGGPKISSNNDDVNLHTEKNIIYNADRDVLIAGGSKEGNTNNSIINMEKNAIKMTVGKRKKVHTEASAKQIYITLIVAAVAAVIVGIMAGVGFAKLSGGEKKEGLGLTISSLVLSIIFSVVVSVIIIKIKNGEQFKNPEPHTDDDAKFKFTIGRETGSTDNHILFKVKPKTKDSTFEMKEDGNIVINSKAKSIKLNANDPTKTGEKDLSQVDIQQSLIKINCGKSSISITKSGNIAITAEETKEISLKCGTDTGVSIKKGEVRILGKKLNIPSGSVTNKNLTVSS